MYEVEKRETLWNQRIITSTDIGAKPMEDYTLKPLKRVSSRGTVMSEIRRLHPDIEPIKQVTTKPRGF